MTNLRIPILTYHSIDDSESVISVSLSKFKSQMKFLKKAGFQTISLKETTECIRSSREFPKKSITITFDDGFKNVYAKAYPVLKEFGFTATIFLVTRNCGKDNQWDRQSKKIPGLDLLCWDEIIEMSKNGMDFGAHTVSHPNLSELPIEQVTEEIAKSKSIIQGHLGKDNMFFAYPYGRQTEDTKRIVKNEFYGACSDKMGFTTLKSDIYSLPRIDMYYFSKNNWFEFLQSPRFYYYVKYRDLLRSIKSLLNL